MPGNDNEALWRAMWTGDPPLPTHRKRKVLAHIPHGPRCKLCLAPFHGFGAPLMRLIGIRPSSKNPNFCAVCEAAAEKYPVGAGVHAGIAFVGTIEGTLGVERDIAAVGNAVNTTARLASAAGAGEVLISEDALRRSGFDPAGLEVRQLNLKGKAQPFTVHVVPAAAPIET